MKNYLVMGVANQRSIAWAIAKELVKHGNHVLYIVMDERAEKHIRNEESAADIFYCNVQVDQDIKQLAQELHTKGVRLDGLVHAIAHARKEDLEGSFMDTSREGFQMAMDISVFSLVAVTKALKPLMNPGAAVLTMTYLGGERVVRNYNVMGVCKAALDASVRYLAVDLGAEGKRINAISAGPIKTLAARGVSGFNDIFSIYEEKAPLRRNLETDEVAKAAHFLLSDMSSGITGEILHVDCGYSIIG